MAEPPIWKEQLKKEQFDRLFPALVDAFTERLYWHIRSILLRHDWTDDVLQECYIKTWKAEHPKTCRVCELIRDFSILIGTITMPMILALIGNYGYY